LDPEFIHPTIYKITQYCFNLLGLLPTVVLLFFFVPRRLAMIVYNVERSFFPLKAEADSFRRSKKLPYHRTARLDVRTRDELAAILNAVAAGEMPEPGPEIEPQGDEPPILAAITASHQHHDPDDPDVPAFLKQAATK
jgi:hypothetical protein